MATLAQLRAEPEWGREIVTPAMRWLGDQWCAATGRPVTAVGTKGNVAHLSGAHRSQEWLLNSVWCRQRTYTVQRGLTGEQPRHIAALDLTPGAWGTAENRRRVQVMTRRLVTAGVAGRLPGVFEVIGTLDGWTPVGVDLPEGQVWPADDSHLEHVHHTFDRRRCADQQVMERVLAVVLGGDDTVSKEEVLAGLRAEDEWASSGAEKAAKAAGEGTPRSALVKLEYVLSTTRYTGVALQQPTATLLARVDKAAAETVALIKAGGGSAEVAALVAAMAKLTEAVTAVQTGQTALTTTVNGLRSELAEIRRRLATAFGP